MPFPALGRTAAVGAAVRRSVFSSIGRAQGLPPFALHTLVASVAAALAFMPLGTSAQEKATTTPQTATLPVVEVTEGSATPNGKLTLDTPVETGSRLGLTARETPASVTVVDRATIEARGAQDTQEILRAVPGVTAHDAPGSVGVSYRGFGSGSLGQLFNGITVQYSIAARPVDSWIYDRVEAIGGPSSFLFGSGAVGGSINYITKTPERTDFTEAQVRAGSHRLREVSIGINRRLGSAATATDGGSAHFARLDLNHRDGGSWTEGTERRATQLAASLLSDLGGGWSHLLAYEYQNENVHRPYWGTPVLQPAVGELRIDPGTRDKNYNSADGLYAQRVQWLRSVAQWRVSDALQLRNTLYAYDALRDYRNVETYAFNATNTAVARSGVLLQRHDHEVIGNRLEANYHGTLAGRRSDWSAGLDFSVNRQTRFPNSLSTTVSTVDPYNFTTEYFFHIPGMKPGFQPDRDNKVTTTAVYLENRTALAPALQLITALRHERIALDLTNRRAITATSPAHMARTYEPTTGRMGLVWDVAPGMNLYAQYATAADPPAGVLSTATFANVRDNTELTTGRSYEVGSKLDFWGGKGTATVAAFHITRKNIATQDPNNSSQTLLVGEQSSKGVELAAGLRPHARWQLQGNLVRTQARYENFVQGGVSLAGKTPTNTPQTVANLWVSYALTPTWTASAGVRHVGKVYANAANTQHWPAYTLLDLGVAWKLQPATTLTARLRNATDRIYAANAGSGQVYLGAPRTLDVTLHTAFYKGRAPHAARQTLALPGSPLAGGAAVQRLRPLVHLWHRHDVRGLPQAHTGRAAGAPAPAARGAHCAATCPGPASGRLAGPTARAAAGAGQWRSPRVCGHPATELEPGSKAARRSKTAPVVIDATTGELIRNVSAAHALASAQTFASSRDSALAADAYPQHLGMVSEDAFTHSRALDMHRPLHTVALGDADDTVVYVSNATGEVVRDATRTERLWNYAGAWIHWLYPFRGNMFDRYWTDIVNWLSIAGVVLALTGTVVGVLRWRFTGPRYKSGSRSPYPGGMMKWHHTTGLLFAAVTITWVFSGLMSMNPWKLFDSGAPPLRTAAMHGGPLQLANGAPLASVQALLAQATPNVRELRWVRAAGHTVVQAWSPSGVATLLDATTAAHHAIAPRELTAAAARLVDAPVQEVQTLNAYDLHYYDRAPHTMGGGADKPLPVWRVVFADPHATWVHIDPRTGTVLGRTDTHRRTSRWLFSMLHSWDWLPLLERRPLWDVVLIVLSLGGTALSVTGVVVGWRRLRVKARSGAKAAHPRTARAAAASAPTGRASPQAGNV